MSTNKQQSNGSGLPPEEPEGNGNQAFGLQGVKHHLTLLRAEFISKETARIDKKDDRSCDLPTLIECLEVFIREKFGDEPEPHALAAWFTKQYQHRIEEEKARAKRRRRKRPRFVVTNRAEAQTLFEL
jgi:hypothetical protein